MTQIIFICLSFCLGSLLTYLFFRIKKGSLEDLANKLISAAESEVKIKKAECEVVLKQKEYEHRQSLDTLIEKRTLQLSKREEKLDRQLALVEKNIDEIEKRKKEFSLTKQQLDTQQKTLTEKHVQYEAELIALSTLSASEAKDVLFKKLEKELEADFAKITLKQKKEIEEEVERYATQTIATAINRLCLTTVSEIAVTTVALPSHEMKGRVIGREGRNIRALEQATGVNFVIDDTPNAVVISGFDPIRKEVAKVALKDLIQDGRIHPTRIEEFVQKAQSKVTQMIINAGELAAHQAGVFSLHPELIQLLGKLHFRYSYGQNVLKHSVEVSHLMGIMAAELKLNVELAKRIGLLHDIGKVVSQEIENSHALIGRDLVLKYGESEEVANGIGCHHEEILPQTIEASLCAAADKISGGRPGARIEALEQYLKRAQKLEFLSQQFEGVEEAYAMQAGREIRVIVKPDRFDDNGAIQLARALAKKIETELSYPGKIKVTVIREKRAIEYAT